MSNARPTTGIRTDTLADGVLILLVLTAVQRGAGFIRSVLFCRWLDEGQLGQWDLSFGFLMLAAPIAVLSLPATFGRYVEHYRQRGQLRMFLGRLLVAVALLAAGATMVLASCHEWFSQLIFGRNDCTLEVLVLAGALLATIACNVVHELFTALRLQRLASALELANSVGFATIGVVLIVGVNASAVSVIVAFGVAAALAVAMSLVWLARCWRSLPRCAAPVAHASFWGKLAPFAAWVWISNWLGNLFQIIERYMLIHYSGRSPQEALGLVGQYHSARIVPLLLLNVAMLLSALVLPFLSRDWDLGRRDTVAVRLNLLLKLTGIGFVAVATLVLLASPILFSWALRGKFVAGEQLLPYTLTVSVWFGMFCLAKTWLWCDERVRLVSLAFLAGLGINVGLNLLLLAPLGLQGAALSAAAANLVVLLTVLALNYWRGLSIDRGVWLVTALPLALLVGPWGALGGLALVAALIASTPWILNIDEKNRLWQLALSYRARLAARFGRFRPVASAKEVGG